MSHKNLKCAGIFQIAASLGIFSVVTSGTVKAAASGGSGSFGYLTVSVENMTSRAGASPARV